jgi:maltose O-acetyltransferase
LTERLKMEAGQKYDHRDPDLVQGRQRARVLLAKYSSASPFDLENRQRILEELLMAPTDAYIEPPFYCDYWRYIKLGKGVYFNFGCVILDVNRVTIGDTCLFGPFCQILTATHPIDGNERRTPDAFIGYSKPISIGKGCWFGGGAIVCPGVTIGDNCVIGSGAVVAKDVAPNSVVAGNPARLLRTVPPLRPR